LAIGTSAGTPLLQTSFLPLFTQVNLIPPTVVVEFNFVHVPPALTDAKADVGAHKTKARDIATTERFIS
jgi:hypothetical protein